MGSVAGGSRAQLFSLFGRIQRDMSSAKVLEEAAQKASDTLYEEFKEALALIRVYVTVPYGTLPPTNKKWVDGLASAKQIRVKDNTPVLSLVGTRGEKPNWNDRRKSEGHVGIPLASSEFVEAIPMVARLLKDLSTDLTWIDAPDPSVHMVKGDWSGLFHVPDASSTLDVQKRKIIPAQDFVQENKVKTVFGVGGSYASGALFAVIFFTREEIAKDVAERFMPLNTTFKTATAPLMASNRVFQS